MCSGDPRAPAGERGEYPGALAIGIEPALPGGGGGTLMPAMACADDAEAPADVDVDAAAAAADAAAIMACEFPSIIIICGVGGVGSCSAFICSVLWTCITAWALLLFEPSPWDCELELGYCGWSTLLMAMALPNAPRESDEEEEDELPWVDSWVLDGTLLALEVELEVEADP